MSAQLFTLPPGAYTLPPGNSTFHYANVTVPWTSNPTNMRFLGLCSVCLNVSNLASLVSAMGFISVVRLVPEEHLRHLVLEKWYVFVTPLLLNQLALFLGMSTILGVASFLYNERWLIGGLTWAGVTFATFSVFQIIVAEAVKTINFPTKYTFGSVVRLGHLITVTVVPPQDLPPDAFRLVYVRDEETRKQLFSDSDGEEEIERTGRLSQHLMEEDEQLEL
jgi:hypothetical protein